MAGRSKVKDLPPELRTQLDGLLREGRFTLDEVMAHLRKLAGDAEGLPSRSSVGRYAQNFAALSARVKRSQEIADRLVAECGPEIADGKGFQVLLQGFQSLAFDFLANLPEDQTLDPENLSFLARAISSVASAQKTDTDRQLKLKMEAKKEAAAAVEKVAARTAGGMSRETIDAIKAEILGIKS